MKKSLVKILKKSVPLWLVLVLILNTSMVITVAQYLLFQQKLNRAVLGLSKTTDTQNLINILRQEVFPTSGYVTSVKWKNLGQMLVDVGAIDRSKFAEIFSASEMKYLDAESGENITIRENNARFLVNTFWALGLVNKNKVLDEGPMRSPGIKTASMASTGGWILGKLSPMELYSSKELIKLTSQQQELVKEIAQNVFRPCCGNSTYFPDCNHGMAALGFIEYAVSEGVSKERIYKDLLALNSFWFPQNYLEIAEYFNMDLFTNKPSFFEKLSFKKPDKKIKWSSLDSKKLLSAAFSSSEGAKNIGGKVENLNEQQFKGGGCSA